MYVYTYRYPFFRTSSTAARSSSSRSSSPTTSVEDFVPTGLSLEALGVEVPVDDEFDEDDEPDEEEEDGGGPAGVSVLGSLGLVHVRL